VQKSNGDGDHKTGDIVAVCQINKNPFYVGLLQLF